MNRFDLRQVLQRDTALHASLSRLLLSGLSQIVARYSRYLSCNHRSRGSSLWFRGDLPGRPQEESTTAAPTSACVFGPGSQNTTDEQGERSGWRRPF